MASVSKAYTATGNSANIRMASGEEFTYTVTGTFVATYVIEKSEDLVSWTQVATGTTTASETTVQVKGSTTNVSIYVRSRCSAYTSGTMTVVTADSTSEIIEQATDLTGKTVWSLTESGVDITGNLTVSGTTTTSGATTVSDNDFTITDNADATKIAAFQCSGITTGNTRTFTFPDASTTLVGTDTTQTLTNKTLTAPTINNAATISVDDDNFTITDNADQTKIAAFQCSGITTATTRTLTVQDADGTIGYTGKSRTVVINAQATIGGTAGWAVAAAADTGYLATCPASQTASTLVVPISGIGVGDTVTAFHVIGQIESAGNTATLDADLRKHTAVAADPSDASVGAITQVSVTADTKVDNTNAQKTGLSEVLAQDETLYVKLTATTAASTDIILLGIGVTFTDTSGS